MLGKISVRTWWQHPLLHFLILGGLFFVLKPGQDESEADATVVVSSARLETLESSWKQLRGRSPNSEDWLIIERQARSEALLFHHALALGLDENDRTVRFRLIQNMRFLGEEGTEEELYRRALDLGLHRTDPVVRRYLVAKMQLAAQHPASPEAPVSEQRLRLYFELHAERWLLPERFNWVQVFSREEAGEDAARQLLKRLREAESEEVAGASTWGDPSPWASGRTSHTRDEIARSFGESFANALGELPTGSWEGPLRSPWGWHLVRVEARTPAHLPAIDEVRSKVLVAISEERRSQRLDRFLAELEQRYMVRFEPFTRARDHESGREVS